MGLISNKAPHSKEALDNRSPVEAIPCANGELRALTGAAEGLSRAFLMNGLKFREVDLGIDRVVFFELFLSAYWRAPRKITFGLLRLAGEVREGRDFTPAGKREAGFFEVSWSIPSGGGTTIKTPAPAIALAHFKMILL
ncbi:MAG: hypothetical protein ACK6BC_00430 [Cyanobacteriota bacterium]